MYAYTVLPVCVLCANLCASLLAKVAAHSHAASKGAPPNLVDLHAACSALQGVGSISSQHPQSKQLRLLRAAEGHDQH